MENDQQQTPNEKKPLSLFQNPQQWSDEPVEIIDASVYRTIWLEPTDTFKKLVSVQSSNWVKRQIILLFVFGGIVLAINRMGDKLTINLDSNAFGNIWLAIVIEGLLGWIIFYIYSGVLCWIAGKMLSGTAKVDDYKTIIAWSIVPMIVAIIFRLLRIFVFENSDLSQLYSFMVTAPEILFIIWTLVLLIKGIKLIQSFSTIKAIVSIFLSFIIFPPIAFVIGYILRFALGNY